MKTITIICLLFLSTFLASQNTSNGWVKRVIDGDTYVVDVESYKGKAETITVRLVNVDCPELAFRPKKREAQEYGQTATDSVRSLIEGKNIKLTYYGKDYFGRVLSFVHIGGNRLDNIILANGWGWLYTKYHKKKKYKEGLKIMETARKDKKGLWAFPNPIEPSVYRK